jgi:hypothetical protein
VDKNTHTGLNGNKKIFLTAKPGLKSAGGGIYPLKII